MGTTMRRAASTVLAAAAITATAAPLSAAPAGAATLPHVGVSAYAYGTYAVVGGVVRSGPTAYSGIGCTTSFGRVVKGTSAAVNAAPVGTVGVTNTTASTSVEGSLEVSRASASTGAVNLLGGLVRADAVSSAATGTVNASGAYGGGNRSQLLGLTVGGRALSATPAPNTALTVRGSDGAAIATVRLNRQTRAWVGHEWQVTTIALQVVVTGRNSLGLPIGSTVLVGVSSTMLSRPVVGLVGGVGYATSATAADGAVVSSRTALAYPRCAGGTSTATLATARVPGVVTTGTTTTDTVATGSPTARSVRVVDRVATPRFLDGLITVDAVVADTTVSQSAPGARPVVTDGSRFVALHVAGLPAVTASVPANTVVHVPGLGRVTLHKVTRTASSIEVVMIEVVTERAFGSLPTGSVVRVGYSATRLA